MQEVCCVVESRVECCHVPLPVCLFVLVCVFVRVYYCVLVLLFVLLHSCVSTVCVCARVSVTFCVSRRLCVSVCACVRVSVFVCLCDVWPSGCGFVCVLHWCV